MFTLEISGVSCEAHWGPALPLAMWIPSVEFTWKLLCDAVCSRYTSAKVSSTATHITRW